MLLESSLRSVDPFGKFLEKVLPDYRFRLFGQEHSLNPGPFNRKEHMLITIMCSVSFTAPYTNYIVPAQVRCRTSVMASH